MFKALLVQKSISGVSPAIKELEESELPEGDVLVDVEYSSFNYKDGLAVTGASGVVRSYPMVPGIDLAGTVAESSNPEWTVGDKCFLNGWGIGEKHWGGFSEKARVSSEQLQSPPKPFTTRDTMAIGTAGYTAMLCVMALQEQGVKPEDGEVLVTGASGGVGSFAVLLLARLGYPVVAATGSQDAGDYLKSLGASDIIPRSDLIEPGKPLQKERWAGVVDTLGSHTLVNACATTRYGGCVTACGLAQGMEMQGTVAPFILRGVKLVGVDSVYAPMDLRVKAWKRLAKELDMDKLESIVQEVPLSKLAPVARRLLTGQIRGRLVVNTAA